MNPILTEIPIAPRYRYFPHSINPFRFIGIVTDSEADFREFLKTAPPIDSQEAYTRIYDIWCLRGRGFVKVYILGEMDRMRAVMAELISEGLE